MKRGCILRYWSITSPLRYLRRRTKKRALVMIGLAWLASSTWVVPVLGWHYFEFGGVRQNQNDVCKTEFAANVPFKVISAIFNFYIPTTCMVVLYVRIFLAIKERSREMEKMTAIQGNVGNVDQANDSLTEDDCNDQGRKVKNHKPPHCVQSLHRANLQGSFSSIERKHLCSEHPFSGKTDGNGHQSNNGRHHQKPPSDVETQFQRLTILAFPQSSLVQSMALSHREYSPVSQFEGVKVSVEYIENRLCVDQGPKWPSEQYVGDKNGRQICDDLEHSTHLQCYRTAKSFKGSTKICNGAMPRSRSDNRIDYELCKSSQIKEAKSRYSSTNSMKPILGNFFSRSTQRKGGGDRRNTSNVLAKEKKAATQLGVIVGAFIFCWLPYFILFMVVAYCDSYPSQCSVPYILEVSTTWCGYLNSTLNPILYPLCNKNFKIAFKRMLGSPRQVDGTLARKQ